MEDQTLYLVVDPDGYAAVDTDGRGFVYRDKRLAIDHATMLKEDGRGLGCGQSGFIVVNVCTSIPNHLPGKA
jgi:hypothetical protein